MRSAWCLPRVLANLGETNTHIFLIIFLKHLQFFHFSQRWLHNHTRIILVYVDGIARFSDANSFFLVLCFELQFCEKDILLANFALRFFLRHSSHTWTFLYGLKLKLKPNCHKSQQLTVSKKWIKMLNIN